MRLANQKAQMNHANFRPPTPQNHLFSVIDEQITWLGGTFRGEISAGPTFLK